MGMPRGLGAAGLAAACALGLAGCQFNLQGLPSPGGGPPGDSHRLTAVFADVLNLPQRAQVKLDGVVVGQVTTIRLDHDRGVVEMAVDRKIRLPGGTTAEIRFTTPLGEDYISLTRPATPAGPDLGDGSTLGEPQTSSAPTIEDTFALLSAVLNGGGLDQLRTIIVELNKAFGGHEGPARDLLDQLGRLVGALNARSGDIDHALDALNTLSAELNGQSSVIAQGLDSIAPALQVLASQASDFDQLLTHLGRLGSVGSRVLDESRDAFLADLRELGPVVDALVGIRGQIGSTLDALAAFGPAAVGVVPGDHLQLNLTLNAQLGAGSGTGGGSPLPLPLPLPLAAPATGADAAHELLGSALR
ncbi:MAG TPA: MCE family protein [Candidatus Dormibacteraeota bacterium]|nr:MCE family protein [Candidatus Dormibacteraeota bacterium]